MPAWESEKLRLFAADIQDLDYARATRAVEVYRRTRRERPQPCDIRALVTESTLQLLGPEQAWGILHEAIQRCDQEPVLHPAIVRALRYTGRSWQALRVLPFDQYAWLRRDFLAAYREVTDGWQTRHQVDGTLLPTRTEAKQILGDLQAYIAETKQIEAGGPEARQ